MSVKQLLYLRFKNHCRRGNRKVVSLSNRGFSVRVCLKGMSDMTHMESQYHDCKHELNKDNINRPSRLDGKSILDIKTIQRTTDILEMLRVGEIVFSMGEHTKWLSSTM